MYIHIYMYIYDCLISFVCVSVRGASITEARALHGTTRLRRLVTTETGIAIDVVMSDFEKLQLLHIHSLITYLLYYWSIRN